MDRQAADAMRINALQIGVHQGIGVDQRLLRLHAGFLEQLGAKLL